MFDKNIGFSIQTPIGSIITIVKSAEPNYLCSCSKCSTNGELFATRLSKLKRGMFPCGCSVRNGNRPKQKKIHVNRTNPGHFYVVRHDHPKLGSVLKFGVTRRDTPTRMAEHVAGIRNVKSTIIRSIYFEDQLTTLMLERVFMKKFNTGVVGWLTSGNTETISANTPLYEIDEVIRQSIDMFGT